MVSKQKPFSERFINMTPDQRREHLEESAVLDRSKLSEQDLAQSSRMIHQARRNVRASRIKSDG